MSKGHVKTADVRDFAVRFASIVTFLSKDEETWIAKNGEPGLFSIFAKMMPQVSNPPAFQRRC